jgi:predicted protein tyrosine phosphatase
MKNNTVRFISWGASLAEEFGGQIALIQILNPGMTPYNIRCERQLVLSFWDRNELDLKEGIIARLFGKRPDLCVLLHRTLLGDNGGWPWRPPLTDDARRIKEFVDSIPDAWDFVVICELGRSRSRAVAEWISNRRKIQAVGNTAKGNPNSLLVALLSALC